MLLPPNGEAMAQPKLKQASLGGGSMLVDASPLVSRSPVKGEINPYVPELKLQPRLFTGELLPSVEIPKPPVKAAKPVPKEQMELF